MSQKITSKNLTYDQSLPPFLARLRGQHTNQTGPDPILASHRRPGQKRSASEEAEDAPVIVDEDGNVVQLPDGGLEKPKDKVKDGDDDKAAGGEEEDKASADQEKEKVAGIGGLRKRKVGRVIGEVSDDEKQDSSSSKKAKGTVKNDEARVAKASADVRRLMGEQPTTPATGDGNLNESQAREGQGSKPAKKKSAKKKIKLSFGDDGE